MKSTSAAVQAEIAKTVIATPITLLELYLDGSTVRIADHPIDVSFGGNTYTSRSVKHSDILTHFSNKLDGCDVSIDDTDKAMSAYMAVEDFKGRLCKILKVFDGLTSSSDVITQFVGFMNQPESDGSWMSYSMVPVFDRSQSYTPWRRIQSRCNWRYCSTQCGYNSGSEIRGTADSGSTTTLVDATYIGKAAGFAVGGRCRILSGTNKGEARYVTSFNTSTGEFGFSDAYSSAIDNTSQYIIECDKTKATCKNFSNYPNFGGYEAIGAEWANQNATDFSWVLHPYVIDLQGHLPLVYGQARVPGILIAYGYATTQDSLDEGYVYKGIVTNRIYGWCEGEIDSINEVFVQGGEIPTTGLRYAERLGTTTQQLDKTDMVSTIWYFAEDTYYFRRTAFSAFTFECLTGDGWHIPDGFTDAYINIVNYLPGDALSANIKGLKVQKYLANGTADGSPVWSQNPVWCLLDFLMSRSVKPLDSSYIDFSAAKTAADYCDTKGWRCNLVIDRQKKDEDLVDLFLAAFGGFITYTAGKMVINIEKAESYVMDFDDTEGGEDNINDGELTDWENDLNDVYNRVIVEYIDEEIRDTAALLNGALPAAQTTIDYADNNKDLDSSGTVYIGGEAVTYTGNTGSQLTGCSARSQDYPSGYPMFQGAQLFPKMTAQYDDYEHQDNCKRTIEKKVDGSAIPTYRQAYALAEKIGRQSVEGNKYIKFKAGPAAMLLEPGNVVRVTHSRPGWTLEEFRIMKIAESQDEELEMELALYDSSFYGENSQNNGPLIATTLPSPYDAPPSVTGLTLASTHSINEAGVHLSAITITYTRPTGDAAIFWDHTRIYMKRSTETYYRFIRDDYSGGAGITIDAIQGEFQADDIVSVRVVSISDKGAQEDFDSAPTDSITVDDDVPTPGDPASLTLEGASGGTIWDGKKFAVNWSSTISGNAGYWEGDEIRIYISSTLRYTSPLIKNFRFEYNYGGTGFAGTFDSYLKAANGDCEVRVYRKNLYSNYSTGYASLSITQADPTNPQNLTSQGFVGGARFSWDANTEDDFSHYLVRTKLSSGGTWSDWLNNGNVTSKARELTDTEAATYGGTVAIYIEVKAVDIWGNESTVSSTNVNAIQSTGDFILDECLGWSKLLAMSPENIVEDASWEASDNDIAWTYFENGFDVQQTEVHSGANACHAQGNSTTHAMYQRVYIEVKPGEQYYLEAYSKTSAGANGTYRPIYVGFYDETKTFVSSDGILALAAPQTSWTKSNCFVEVPAGCYFMRIGICVNTSATTGDFYFDDLFAKRAVLTEFIVNAAITNAKIADLAVDDAKINDLSADKINAGMIVARAYSTADATTYLTSAYSSGSTLTMKDTTNFSSSGSGFIIDSSNDRDWFTWTGKTATTLTGCVGLAGAHSIGAVVIESGQAIVMSDLVNELRFFGDRYDGTVEELCNIGIKQDGSDYIIIGAGTYNSTRVAVKGKSSTVALWGQTSGNGSTSVIGYASGTGATGGLFDGNTGYGVRCAGDMAPLVIERYTASGIPSHNSYTGSIFLSSDNLLCLNVSPSTSGTTWRALALKRYTGSTAINVTNGNTQSIATGYSGSTYTCSFSFNKTSGSYRDVGFYYERGTGYIYFWNSSGGTVQGTLYWDILT